MLNALLLAGHDVHAITREGETALMIAADIGGPAAVRALLAGGARIDAVDIDGNGALHYAALALQWECADILRLHGANMDAPNHAGETPAQITAHALEGIDVNVPLSDGQSRLMEAAQDNLWTLMEALIIAGAPVDALAADGTCALMRVAGAGHWAAMDSLRCFGADMDAANHKGETPFLVALQKLENAGDAGLGDDATTFATMRRLLDQDQGTHMEMLLNRFACINAIDHCVEGADWEIIDPSVDEAAWEIIDHCAAAIPAHIDSLDDSDWVDASDTQSGESGILQQAGLQGWVTVLTAG